MTSRTGRRRAWQAGLATLMLAMSGCGTKAYDTCPGRFLLGPLMARCSEVGDLYQPLPLKQDKALVYVYRPSRAAASAVRVDVYLNDQLLTKLSNRTYSYAHVDPGTVTIRAMVGQVFNEKSLVMNVEVEAGKVYFVEHATSATVAPMGSMTQYTFTYTLTPTAPAVAEPRIAQCYVQIPEVEAWR